MNKKGSIIWDTIKVTIVLIALGLFIIYIFNPFDAISKDLAYKTAGALFP